jgi:hypothetical protein
MQSGCPVLARPRARLVGDRHGLSISDFGATAQPIPFLIETAQWLSTGRNGTAVGPCNFWPYDTVQLNNPSLPPDGPDGAAQRIFLAYAYATHDAGAYEGIVRSYADDVKHIGIFQGTAPSAPRGFVHDIR